MRPPEGLVAYLRRATDKDLEKLCEAQDRAAAKLLSGFTWKDRKPLDELKQFRAAVAAEQYRRRDAIRHAEAELNDGHLVMVGYGTVPATFTAWCLPGGDDYCWVGPDHASIEEALDDGRRHSPKREPDLWPYPREGPVSRDSQSRSSQGPPGAPRGPPARVPNRNLKNQENDAC